MLDIKYIRDNSEKVQQNAKNKGYDVDIALLLEVDQERKELQIKVDDLREKEKHPDC